jgi:hypothetical protein
VLAIAATATAAGVLITSSRQIENGVVKRKDLAPSVRAALARSGTPGAQGPVGPQGEQGPPGEVGPSNAYSVRLTANVQLNGVTRVLEVDLPEPGAYVVLAHALLVNGTHEAATTRCWLRAVEAEGAEVVDLAFVQPTIAADGPPDGLTTNANGLLTVHGTHDFEAPGKARLDCQGFTGQLMSVGDATLTAIRVGALTRSTNP